MIYQQQEHAVNGKPRAVDSATLIALASEQMTGYTNYLPSMEITAVRQQGNLLIFSGPWFADAQGLPTKQSTAAFNVFKALTQELSPLYCLKQ